MFLSFKNVIYFNYSTNFHESSILKNILKKGKKNTDNFEENPNSMVSWQPVKLLSFFLVTGNRYPVSSPRLRNASRNAEKKRFEKSWPFESAREYRSRKFFGNLDRIVATDASTARRSGSFVKNSRGRKGVNVAAAGEGREEGRVRLRGAKRILMPPFLSSVMKILADGGKNALVKSAPLCLWNLRDELSERGEEGSFFSNANRHAYPR